MAKIKRKLKIESQDFSDLVLLLIEKGVLDENMRKPVEAKVRFLYTDKYKTVTAENRFGKVMGIEESEIEFFMELEFVKP